MDSVGRVHMCPSWLGGDSLKRGRFGHFLQRCERPRYLASSPDSSAGDTRFGLQQVQHQVAIDAGYQSWEALLDADEFDRHLAIVMGREPQLNQFGFGSGAFGSTVQDGGAQYARGRDELRARSARVDEIREWLVRYIVLRQTINTAAGSYGLKHLAAKDLGAYVTNGEFIAAAIIAGYPYRRGGGDSPNAVFGMSAPSITALRRRLSP